MTLCPSYRMDNGKIVRVRTGRNAQVAVTQYQVLSSTASSALLELQPVTGEGPPSPWEEPPRCPLGLGLGPALQRAAGAAGAVGCGCRWVH